MLNDRTVVRGVLLLGLTIVLGCGGGGGGGNSDPAPIPPPPTFEVTTISPAGGEYLLDNGIQLTVPAGAVSEETEIALRLVPDMELTGILGTPAGSDKTVLAAVQALHPGVSFAQPVTLALPFDGSLPSTSLPLLLVVDLNNQIYSFDTSAIPDQTVARVAATVPNPAVKYVQIDCENDRVIIANISKLPEDERVLVAAGLEKLRAESDCFTNPCRCCMIRVQEQTLDVIKEDTSGTCFNSVIEGSVQYLDCGDGQLTETFSLSENSAASVTLNPATLELQVGTGAAVSLRVLDAAGKKAEFYSIQGTPTSSDEAVASVTSVEPDQDTFYVVAHNPGETTITVMIDCQITTTLTVTVHPIRVITDVDAIIVPEGTSSTVRAHLDTPPPEDRSVYVDIARTDGDTDISVVQGSLMIFDASNWNVDQQVTFAAAEDDDTENGSAAITFSSAPNSSGKELLEPHVLVAHEADNDLLQLVVSSGGIYVPEGGSAVFTVRLSNQPPETVEVSVAHVFGDPDITVALGGVLTFGPGDWDTEQAVLLAAAEDDQDIEAGVATIRVTDLGAQLGSVDVRATEIDNDSLELTVTPGNLCIERNQTGNLSVIASTPVDFSTLQWASSDTEVATVDQTGIVTAVSDGPAQIVALANGVRGTANIEVKEHCFTVDPADLCLHAPIPGVPTLPTNLLSLQPSIDTALAGHSVSYTSSNESIVTVDATGTATAQAGGDTFISVRVDNVVTEYFFQDAIAVHVAGDLNEYRLAPTDLPIFTRPASETAGWLPRVNPYALFLTDERNLYTQGQIVTETAEAGGRCGGFPSAPDIYTVTDFNNDGEYVGYSEEDGPSRAIYLNSELCIFKELGTYGVEKARAINVAGLAAVDIVDEESNDRVALVTRDGTVTVPYAQYAKDLNDSGILLLSAHGSDPVWWDDECFDGYALVDTNLGADPIAFTPLLVPPEPPLTQPCDHKVPVALNNLGIVTGYYQWGQYEENLLGTYAYATYPDGMYLYYGGTDYYVPVGTMPLDVNDSQDILGVSSSGAYVAHVCPFSLETNVCDWIQEGSRAQSILYHENAETLCDGLDNDCDGLVDEALSPDPTPKQAGVCAGAEMKCEGRSGWVADYAAIPGYEFPEASCDGQDNDCDGLVDEGIDVDGDGHYGVPLCGDTPDCDDTDPSVFPGASEICNGRDDNCDGTADEECVP